MKSKKIKLISKTLLVVCILSFFSCKKKDSPVTTPPTPMGTIAFHLHTNIDTTEADSGVVVMDHASGKKFQLNVAQFYISGIVAYKTDGTAESVSNVYILKNISQEEYIIGQVPAGNYSRISFNVGLDVATNATNPSSHTGVLGTQNPAMWFGNTTQGYLFMNVQGFADTTTSNTGNVNHTFAYQLGGNAELKTINMPTMANSVVVTASNTNALPAEFHIICDYGILLNNINFKTINAIATPFNSDSTVIKQISNNIPNMFRYEI
ncbi:MAG TPA: MbnP family protein [Bacteroidia bacterium]|nr:MbnP family protein [Bacteroidia bacterium]